jgi:hypothetical protein
MLGGILAWSMNCRILYDLSPFGYICMMIHVYFTEFVSEICVFTLALSVNNLFEERLKTNAEFIIMVDSGSDQRNILVVIFDTDSLYQLIMVATVKLSK